MQVTTASERASAVIHIITMNLVIFIALGTILVIVAYIIGFVEIVATGLAQRDVLIKTEVWDAETAVPAANVESISPPGSIL